MIAAKVQETNNYRMFELLEFNRDVTKVKLLTASMKKHGWINSKPMSVVANGNGKLKIRDGHHRFEIAQRLGLSVKFVIDKDNATVFELDASTNKWTMQDTLTSYARGQNIEYVKVMEYCRKTGIAINQAISMLSGNQAGTNNFRTAFREGKYTCKNTDNANIVADIVLFCKKHGIEWVHHALFVSALSRIAFIPDFSPARMKTKIKAFPYLIEKRPHLEGYMDMLESIYNYKSQDRVPLKFMADKVARERNIIFALK